ncbi:hypothetical protein [Kutzneria sp. CA-103260]|uniref:hypothetical protein n=1 Tax=Kutzneria sp. CA-103260 TaxID=2802641 RepID=UPI001BEFEC70|nr:hypothetical protein [Kutzneria sp. CA-103260]QUQ70760.1 hypothetical protein JJ691_85430 [Kutzneria sp. CA-103260]
MSGSATASLTALNGVSAASELAQAPTMGKALPVLEGLAGLLPWGGLRRGSTVVVRGSTTLLLALLAAATAEGSWAAVVGLPDLGLVAAAELGVVVHRLALVPAPGPELVSVTAALLDGLDLVAVAEQPRAADARRLSARARHRGSVLLPVGDWPGADLELEGSGRWHGLSDGHGRLRARELTVRSRGRGSAARGNQVRLTLPGGDMVDLPTDRPDLTVASNKPEPRPTDQPRLRQVVS